MTNSRPESDSTPSKPRGLWSLMGPSTEPDEAIVKPDVETPAAAEQVAAKEDNGPPREAVPPKQRGLWGMMGQAPPEAIEDVENSLLVPASSDLPASADSPRGEKPAARSLFELMQRAEKDSDETRHVDGDSLPAIEPGSHLPDDDVRGITDRRSAIPRSYNDEAIDEDIEVAEAVDEGLGDPDTAAEAGVSALMQVISPEQLEPPRYRLAKAQSQKQVWIALACGLASLVTCTLSLFPNFLASLPATALGFVAIIAGYLALTGAGRRQIEMSMRGIALLGMLLGTVGIFLGPLFVASLGRALRTATGQQVTRQHLQKIGEALDRHDAQHSAYPIGGIFSRNDAGEIRGQHGWMTFLLPFIGEQELYRQIDQSKPFDDLVNRNAMGRNVNVYFAAGGDRARIGEGFSVSHYAGLGGEIDDASGLSHLGIFERDVAVKRDEITDGLSNTLIVGELGGTYPPWGDPENWRKIGRGLNKDVNGFGSYSGQGATFLLADGSVQFFNNKTDPKLLERMSTRDGSE